MSSNRARFSPPVQVFILIFYFILVFFIKHIYDNNQRNQRYEKYNIMLKEVAHTLEVVEKHAKETAQAVKAIESVHLKKSPSLSKNIQINPHNLHLTPIQHRPNNT